MRNHQMFVRLGLALAAAAGVPSGANAVVFTWSPSAALPALTAGPAAFSADGISVTNFIRTTNVNNLATLKQTFSGTQIEAVKGFTLDGASVSTPGLNSTYGLYFKISPVGTFPINGSGMTVGPATYSSLDIQLVADVGHDDGSVVNNAAGIGFSNVAGTSNDVVLATGSLVSASLGLNPITGARSAKYETTFQPVASEAAFFAGPTFPVSLDIALTTPASAFQVISVDALTVLNVVGANGTAGGTAQFVPEPASVALLGVGALGLLFRERRRSKPLGSLA